VRIVPIWDAEIITHEGPQVQFYKRHALILSISHGWHLVKLLYEHDLLVAVQEILCPK
jgi:hypothetical protein